MNDVNEQEVQIDEPKSSGKILQEAREAKKLSIAEVSAQIRLVRTNIQALETGQWDQLHGRAYARGYFTSYVKFLELPEEDMLAMFNREYEMSASETPSLNNVALAVEKKGFPWLKSVFIIILFVISWFAYQQWQQSEANLEDSASNDLVDSSQPAIESELIEPLQNNSFSDSVVEPISASKLNNTDIELAIEETTVEPTEQIEGAVNSVIGEETIVEDINTLAEVIATNSVETHIELQFTEECWVNVKDADGQSLLNKLMNANTRADLSGLAPLSVSLGRASSVSMKVNDTAFDFTPYTSGNVARFTIEGAS